ncbi:MAG: hypothetical protein NVS9B4_00030 [Candidatus Acidiferrum sp.]
MMSALTQREREVVIHVAAGLTNRQAADYLGIAPNTVRVHLAAAMRKLGVRNRTLVALYVAAAQRRKR